MAMTFPSSRFRRPPGGLLAVAFLCGLTACAPALADDAAPRHRELWYAVLIGGQTSGFSVETTSPLDGGGVETVSRVKMALRRGRAVARVEMRVTTREDADGRVLEFEVEQKQSAVAVHVKGTVNGDAMTVETATAGLPQPVRRDLPYDPKALGPRASLRRAQAALRKEGDTVAIRSFLADQLRCAEQARVLGPTEEIDLPGGKRRLRRVTSRFDFAPNLRSTQWVDDQFLPWKIAIPALGLQMEFVRTTREAILATDFDSLPEVFLATAIPVDGALPRQPSRVRYRLVPRKGKDTTKVEIAPSGAAGQKIEKRGEGTWIVDVRRVRSAKPQPIARLAENADTKRYLEPNAHIQSNDPEIVKTAREIVGDETESLAAAVALERWVRRNVKTKNLETAFATASEVLETRAGDCSEHAVLLAALARAAGIPSRVVVGLVYHRRSFVGHMWTEVYTGDWTPLDATIGRGTVDADHIALSTSPLGADSISDLFLALLPVLGNVEIEVIEAQ